MTTVGEDVEILLTRNPPLPHKAWRQMLGWYQELVDHAPPPAQATLERIMVEYEELYRAALPLGEKIPISVPPSSINNFVPTEEEVKWAVWRLRGHQLGGPSRMRAEHLREWLREHIAAEAATEAETGTVGKTLGPEGKERATTKEGMKDGGEERETTKWEKVVELFQPAFQDRVISE